MTVTEQMRLEWAMKYLKQEAQREEAALKELDSLSMVEIIILRNKKFMYLAEVRQLIRNTEDKLKRLAEGKTA